MRKFIGDSYGNKYIFCYNYLRHCEPEAITNDIFDIIEDRLRLLAPEYSEKSMSIIFL